MNAKIRSIMVGILAGLVLAVALPAIAENVVKRWRGTVVADVFHGTAGLKAGASGTTIADSYAATLTTNFQGIAASTCKDSAAITATGAALLDGCVVGPNATAAAKNVTFTCYVSAADAVKIKVCNQTTTAITDFASGSYTVRSFDP